MGGSAIGIRKYSSKLIFVSECCSLLFSSATGLGFGSLMFFFFSLSLSNPVCYTLSIALGKLPWLQIFVELLPLKDVKS